jgi:uncharacterized integral membrane protein
MGSWFNFLRSFETDGGVILILLLLILIFAVFVKLDFKDAESQMYFILGALVSFLKGKLQQTENKRDDGEN